MKYVTYEDVEKAMSIIERSMKYVQLAHDDAESKHDNYGEYYMDSEQYDIMVETDKLLNKYKELLSE